MIDNTNVDFSDLSETVAEDLYNYFEAPLRSVKWDGLNADEREFYYTIADDVIETIEDYANSYG